jgi:hypothetical protein
MTFDMMGMALVALTTMLLIGGGTTWVYLAGQRDHQGSASVSTWAKVSRQGAWPPASQAVEHPLASGRHHRHGRRRELFLGP